MSTAAAILGDWNLSDDEVAELARRVDGRLARGRGPDHLIAIDADVVDVQVLGKFGSDHHAILYTLDVDSTRVRALGWNVWVGQKPRDVYDVLKQLIRAHEPDMIVLNEAYRCGTVLEDLASYRLHQGRDVGEGADVAVLVQRRHEIVNQGVLQMQQRWTVVSHDKLRPGREYPFDRIRLEDGPVLRVLGIHLPTNGPINRQAADESVERIIRWAQPRTKEEHR